MLKRDDFAARLAQKGYTKADAKQIAHDVIDTIVECMANGESIMFHGFGTFSVVEVAEREMIDMQSKERILIPGHKAPKFSPGIELKRIVREGFVRK